MKPLDFVSAASSRVFRAENLMNYELHRESMFSPEGKQKPHGRFLLVSWMTICRCLNILAIVSRPYADSVEDFCSCNQYVRPRFRIIFRSSLGSRPFVVR